MYQCNVSRKVYKLFLPSRPVGAAVVIGCSLGGAAVIVFKVIVVVFCVILMIQNAIKMFAEYSLVQSFYSNFAIVYKCNENESKILTSHAKFICKRSFKYFTIPCYYLFYSYTAILRQTRCSITQFSTARIFKYGQKKIAKHIFMHKKIICREIRTLDFTLSKKNTGKFFQYEPGFDFDI